MARDDPASESYVDTAIAVTLEQVMPLIVRTAVKEAIAAGLQDGIGHAIGEIVAAEVAPLKEADEVIRRLLYGEGDPQVDRFRPGIISIAYSLHEQATELKAQGRLVRWMLPVGTGSGIAALGIALWRALAG